MLVTRGRLDLPLRALVQERSMKVVVPFIRQGMLRHAAYGGSIRPARAGSALLVEAIGA